MQNLSSELAIMPCTIEDYHVTLIVFQFISSTAKLFYLEQYGIYGTIDLLLWIIGECGFTDSRTYEF